MATNDGLAVKEYCSKTLGLVEWRILYFPDATYGKMRKAMRDIKSRAEAFNGDIKENVPAQSVLINGSKQTSTIVVPDNMSNDWRNRKLVERK